MNWSGKRRVVALEHQQAGTLRRPSPDHSKAWVGVGGNPESVVRGSVVHNLPLMLAIIGGGLGPVLHLM